MKIIVGAEETRTVPVKATKPLNGDKTQEIRFNAEIEVLEGDDWKVITDRWDYLANLVKRERYALLKGLDYEPMTDEEREESGRQSILDVKHLIKSLDLDVEDKDGNALEGDEKIAAVIKVAWLRDPLFDAVVAVQAGKTTEAYRKLRAKNS